MGVDLNFWKYRSGLYLDNAMVYQKACCDNEESRGIGSRAHRGHFKRNGSAWANRPCQCKSARLSDRDQAGRLLEELLQKSIERVVNDFFDRTYYK